MAHNASLAALKTELEETEGIIRRLEYEIGNSVFSTRSTFHLQSALYFKRGIRRMILLDILQRPGTRDDPIVQDALIRDWVWRSPGERQKVMWSLEGTAILAKIIKEVADSIAIFANMSDQMVCNELKKELAVLTRRLVDPVTEEMSCPKDERNKSTLPQKRNCFVDILRRFWWKKAV